MHNKMNEDNRLYSVKAYRQHVLRTLGGLISPVWKVAEEVLGSVTGEELPGEFDHQLQRICADSKALLDKVLEKACEEDLGKQDFQNVKDFYHQHFVAWKSTLNKLVPLLDDIAKLASLTLTQIQEIEEMSQPLRRFLDAKEWEDFC